VINFIVCIIFNGISTRISKYSPVEITEIWNLRISPSGYAFSIWGIIYMLIALFVVYQAIPSHWGMSKRNDHLIFNEIGYWFAANMLFNAMWLAIFQQYNLPAFFVSAVDIIALLITSLMIMMKARRNQCNFFETIGCYVAFSMYSGWVATATILNLTFCIKGLGFSEKKLDIDESIYACSILWVAFAIFVLASLRERNVVFGAVWLWAVRAIKVRQVSFENIQVVCDIILALHSVFLLGLSCDILYKKCVMSVATDEAEELK